MFWKHLKKITRINKTPQVIPSGKRKAMTNSKKKEIKPVAAKKTPEKSAKKKTLVVSSEETSFWVNGGGALRSLKDLRNALIGMNEEQFKYHTKRNGNDFAKWVLHVLQDPKCAADLEKAKTKKSSIEIVLKHLKNYS